MRIAPKPLDALVVLVTEGAAGGADPVSRLVQEARKAGDFESKPGKLLQAYRFAGVAATRLVLAGAGDGTGKRIYAAVHAAVSALRSKGVKRLVICLPADAPEGAVRAAVAGAAEASYVFVATESKPEGRELQRVTIAVAGSAADHKAAFDAARGAASGIEFARELGNLPPNLATPTRLGEEARKLAKAHGFPGATVMGPKEVAKLGMGALLGRGAGIRGAAALHRAEVPGRGRVRGAGGYWWEKASAFDSGGISIKPAPEMDEMKFDMGGAASVLGTFRALGDIRPAVNVVGLIPSCENLPDGRALKPGDVLTSLSGQTVEVLNTDAEGVA